MMAAERLHETMVTSVNTEGYFLEVVVLIDSIPHANLWSVAIGVSTFLIVRLFKRYAPRIPGALVAVVLLTVVVAVFDLSAKGVGVLGVMPSGPPNLDSARHSSDRLPAIVAQRSGGREITFAVSRADRSFRSWLEKYELMELIDQKHFYPTNRHAAVAFRKCQEDVIPESE